MMSLQRQVFVFLFTACAAVSILYGLTHLISGAALLRADSLLESPTSSYFQERAEQLARRAVIWAPGHACQQRLLLANVLYTQYGGRTGNRDVARLNESVQILREVVVDCPALSTAWAAMILGKQAVSELDGEWRAAMRRGIMAGPWQLPINRGAGYSGMQAWGILNEEDKECFLRATKVVVV